MTDVAVIAPVRKTVRVKAPIAHAFEVFTSGLTRWWPHDHGVGRKPIQKVLMEPRLGGRWLEISDDGTQTSVATITLWEPPHRLVMLWQINANWKPDAAMKSEGFKGLVADFAQSWPTGVTNLVATPPAVSPTSTILSLNTSSETLSFMTSTKG